MNIYDIPFIQLIVSKKGKASDGNQSDTETEKIYQPISHKSQDQDHQDPTDQTDENKGHDQSTGSEQSGADTETPKESQDQGKGAENGNDKGSNPN